nr:hypothetical protein [Tateyamaria omphalii]
MKRIGTIDVSQVFQFRKQIRQHHGADKSIFDRQSGRQMKGAGDVCTQTVELPADGFVPIVQGSATGRDHTLGQVQLTINVLEVFDGAAGDRTQVAIAGQALDQFGQGFRVRQQDIGITEQKNGTVPTAEIMDEAVPSAGLAAPCKVMHFDIVTEARGTDGILGDLCRSICTAIGQNQDPKINFGMREDGLLSQGFDGRGDTRRFIMREYRQIHHDWRLT